MASDERPNKIQKREHSPRTEEAAFASAENTGSVNGAAKSAQRPSQPTDDTAESANTATDAAGEDKMDMEHTSETQALTSTAQTSADAPAKLGPPPGMTKSAWKKLKRQQEWEAGREDRKVQRKEKAKARKARKREDYAALREADPSTVTPPVALSEKEREQPEPPRSKRSMQLPITFIFDCSFDDLMIHKEMKSLSQQITRCYSDNKNAQFRAHLAVSSFGGKLKERYDGLLNKQYLSWRGFRMFEEDFVAVADKAKEWMRDEKQGGQVAGKLAEVVERSKMPAAESSEAQAGAHRENGNDEKEGEVIYLSSEGTETLHELKPYSTYIIGGLVDKNRYKGICHKSATERGIKTAKLPIGEFLQMNSRSVLATNHVNEIMLKWLECGNWGEAFMQVIPKRKGGQLRSTGEEDEDGDGDDDGDGDGDEAVGKEAADEAEAVQAPEKKQSASQAAVQG